MFLFWWWSSIATRLLTTILVFSGLFHAAMGTIHLNWGSIFPWDFASKFHPLKFSTRFNFKMSIFYYFWTSHWFFYLQEHAGPSKLNWEQQGPCSQQPSSIKKTQNNHIFAQKMKRSPKKTHWSVLQAIITCHPCTGKPWAPGLPFKSFKKNPDAKVKPCTPGSA
jgi:hypothetical protein